MILNSVIKSGGVTTQEIPDIKFPTLSNNISFITYSSLMLVQSK